ncbi:hypothetical protein D6D02_03342 [Aureobasidium pullulans]|uniref:Wax synthase domain-containing protein n=2 Tax=Aureobasidium pullulans TaxID=5580 RepID=A0A074Y0V7_AURPU|nr:uncharacterized protein M438DRAFT_361020 [Aureobasidium pullulans EXF-150]THV73410.1 hypothetical protein D6D28_03286 [Aureobasidium pullulans]KEQ89539.1 hypothetical protein M438DRAFT_361020 [Aureobasidium pullulans EXF-150]THW29587.1 hypothetical protein D6D25_05977 [Aureobasidium pullulans]THW48323.1 hypothetical protein D6D21_02975 [Aureobasidium pullulans]THW58537.1 hypothetical protein D6D20_07156 [Aureobasidium pullulans]
MFAKEALPVSHYDVTARLNGQYDSLLASGQYYPFTYPFGTLGATVVIIYLLLDHRSRPWLRKARYAAWSFITVFALWSIKSFRARNPAAAFGVGLISAWSILWCSMMLVIKDVQLDFSRVERKESRLDLVSASTSSQTAESNGHASGNAHQDGSTLHARSSKVGTTQAPAQRTGTLAWQAYPAGPFVERLDWVADIFSNFRGMGWNWRISGLPSPPLWVQAQISGNSGTPPPEEDEKKTQISRTGVRRYHDNSSLLKANLWLVCRDVIILDVLKTLISHDAYFWDGNVSAWPNYLPAYLHAFPVIVRSARLLISLSAVYIALQAIFALGPLFFVGMIGPRYIGARGEAWMYPDSFGSFDNVLDKGLAGWWGGWWHQSFRYAFEAPATKLMELAQVKPKSPTGKFISLTIAFVLSGALHACGSYTQMGHTYPLSGPFLFFISQIGGISAQLAINSLLQQIGVVQRCPRWLQRTANFIYVHVWFYYTAPLLCDDFARGGIWLFEPLPFSPLRGLGLGGPGDGFWCWWGGILWWHKGDRWWNTGLAL